jgi:hypothetical protein
MLYFSAWYIGPEFFASGIGTFSQNSYSNQQIHRVLSPPQRVALPTEELTQLSSAVCQVNLQHISRVLPQRNIKSVSFLLRKTSSFL